MIIEVNRLFSCILKKKFAFPFWALKNIDTSEGHLCSDYLPAVAMPVSDRMKINKFSTTTLSFCCHLLLVLSSFRENAKRNLLDAMNGSGHTGLGHIEN